MLSAMLSKRSLTFFQPVEPSNEEHIDISMLNTAISVQSEMVTALQTSLINDAFATLQEDLVVRGLTYAGNSVASRGGYMAEEFVADTYNLDAVIRKSSSRAYTDKSNAYASADITYDGDQQASLKYYKDAESSAHAQENPSYKNQKRIVPSDQKDAAKAELMNEAHKNDLKGRGEAANNQRKTARLIDDKIKGKDGTESTPLSKKQDMEMASAISKDKNTGKKTVDKAKIDKVLSDTGVTAKTKKAIVKNEMKGLTMAAAIGAGLGFSIAVAITLAKQGVTPDSVRCAFAEGTKSGLLSGGQALVGYGIGRTIGQMASHAMEGTLSNLGLEITSNISTMINMGVVGTITISVFSVVQFVRLYRSGIGLKESLIQVGKEALFSLSLLAVSIVAQGIWGGPAGLIVSISSGIIIVAKQLFDASQSRIKTDELREYMIEKSKPLI